MEIKLKSSIPTKNTIELKLSAQESYQEVKKGSKYTRQEITKYLIFIKKYKSLLENKIKFYKFLLFDKLVIFLNYKRTRAVIRTIHLQNLKKYNSIDQIYDYFINKWNIDNQSKQYKEKQDQLEDLHFKEVFTPPEYIEKVKIQVNMSTSGFKYLQSIQYYQKTYKNKQNQEKIEQQISEYQNIQQDNKKVKLQLQQIDKITIQRQNIKNQNASQMYSQNNRKLKNISPIQFSDNQEVCLQSIQSDNKASHVDDKTKIYRIKKVKRQNSKQLYFRLRIWAQYQQMKILVFLINNLQLFKSQSAVEKKGIYQRMAKYIECRTQNECRSKIAKLKQSISFNFQTIIQFLKLKLCISINQKINRFFENLMIEWNQQNFQQIEKKKQAKRNQFELQEENKVNQTSKNKYIKQRDIYDKLLYKLCQSYKNQK